MFDKNTEELQVRENVISRNRYFVVEVLKGLLRVPARTIKQLTVTQIPSKTGVGKLLPGNCHPFCYFSWSHRKRKSRISYSNAKHTVLQGQ